MGHETSGGGGGKSAAGLNFRRIHPLRQISALHQSSAWLVMVVSSGCARVRIVLGRHAYLGKRVARASVIS